MRSQSSPDGCGSLSRHDSADRARVSCYPGYSPLDSVLQCGQCERSPKVTRKATSPDTQVPDIYPGLAAKLARAFLAINLWEVVVICSLLLPCHALPRGTTPNHTEPFLACPNLASTVHVKPSLVGQHALVQLRGVDQSKVQHLETPKPDRPSIAQSH